MRTKKKSCSKCKEELFVGFFNRENRHKDGLRSECMSCQYKQMKKSLTKRIKEVESCMKKGVQKPTH